MLLHLFLIVIASGLSCSWAWAETAFAAQNKPSQVSSQSAQKKTDVKEGEEDDEDEEDFSSLFILDPMTFTDVTEQELSQSVEALRKMEKLNLQLLSRGETSVVSGKLTCEDVLGGVMNVPSDADVNLICQNCYAFCMMELVILQYAEILKRNKRLNPVIEKRIKADLLLLKKILPALLDSCAAAYWAFKDGKLRAKINQLQQKVQSQDKQLNPME